MQWIPVWISSWEDLYLILIRSTTSFSHTRILYIDPIESHTQYMPPQMSVYVCLCLIYQVIFTRIYVLSHSPPNFQHKLMFSVDLSLCWLVISTWISMRHLRGLTGSALDHRSLPPEFDSQHGHIWRVFHLWLRFITFRGHSAHLPYHVQQKWS